MEAFEDDSSDVMRFDVTRSQLRLQLQPLASGEAALYKGTLPDGTSRLPIFAKSVVLSGDDRAQQQGLARVVREARLHSLAYRFGPSSVVRPYGVVHDVERGVGDVQSVRTFFLTLRWDGDLANARIKTLPLPDKLSILWQAARGLAAMHAGDGSRYVLHCDVKPANILWRKRTSHPGYCAAWTDFGLSVAKGPDLPRHLTEAVIGGTYKYLAPEMAQHIQARLSSTPPVTPASDVYSFGMVVWEVLAGKDPFAGHPDLSTCSRAEDFDALYLRLVSNYYRPDTAALGEEARAVPELAAALKGCWETAPERRATAQKVAALLERAVDIAKARVPAALEGAGVAHAAAAGLGADTAGPHRLVASAPPVPGAAGTSPVEARKRRRRRAKGEGKELGDERADVAGAVPLGLGLLHTGAAVAMPAAPEVGARPVKRVEGGDMPGAPAVMTTTDALKPIAKPKHAAAEKPARAIAEGVHLLGAGAGVAAGVGRPASPIPVDRMWALLEGAMPPIAPAPAAHIAAPPAGAAGKKAGEVALVLPPAAPAIVEKRAGTGAAKAAAVAVAAAGETPAGAAVATTAAEGVHLLGAGAGAGAGAGPRRGKRKPKAKSEGPPAYDFSLLSSMLSDGAAGPPRGGGATGLK